MGASGSNLNPFEVGLERLAFAAPPCGYSLGECEFVHSELEHLVALRLYTPADSGPSTRQRWLARKDYEDERTLCLLSHGNADDLGTSAAYNQWFADSFDTNVVVFDYPGYGRSSGVTTTEQNMFAAELCVYDLAVNRMGVPPQKLVVVGKSIGSGPAVHLASSGLPMAGLLLLSPLASGVRCLSVAEHLPSSVLERLDSVFMPSVQRIRAVRVPTCIVHGTVDRLVPIRNAQALLQACGALAQYRHLFVKAAHNDVEKLYPERFKQHVQAFLAHTQTVRAGVYPRDVDS